MTSKGIRASGRCRTTNWPARLLWLVLALAAAPAARAQFNLFLVEGSTERPAPAVYDFGRLYADESASAHFRLRNTSSARATVNVLAVSGVGFTLTSPAVPLGLAPQSAIDLSVAFRAADVGSYSASLHADGADILLTATVAPRPTYRIDPAAGAAFPGPVDFGGVVRGSAATRRITILNETGTVLTVPAISAQGENFALLGTPPSGQALEPRQRAEFTLRFAPPTVGARQGTLTLGDRSYALAGAGIDPPLPKPTLWIDLKQAASARQGTLVVRFDAAAESSGTGTATLDFRGPADAAMAFAAGGRQVTFPIAPGDLQAALPFQTGTTAGVLTFTVQMGEAMDRQSISIAGVAPGISGSEAARSAGAVELRIAGFDNTRSMASVSFTFYDAAGGVIPPGAITADVSSDFGRYFDTSDLGGVFLLRAVFPVTGDAARVASCEAALTNSAGTARTPRTSF